MWSAGVAYGARGHLLGCPTPDDGVFLPVLCTGQPCVSRLGGQGAPYPLVHLPVGPPVWIKTLAHHLYFLKIRNRLSTWLPNYDINTAPRIA